MAGKVGRPRAEIDRVQFEKLCGLQCTEREICSWFDITTKTLNAWCKREFGATFPQVFATKREAGKISLRRAQFRLAEKYPAMAIFLGKQYLDQTDDPRKLEKGEAVENKLGAFLDALTGAVGGKTPDEDYDTVADETTDDAAAIDAEDIAEDTAEDDALVGD